MKTLINSIELISMNYMGSSNNTMHKFGMEYGYIALAMNNMLKDTNNNIKNVGINGTDSIIMDYSWPCIVAIVGLAAAIAMLLLPGVGLTFDTMLIFWIYNGIFLTESGASMVSFLWGCF